MNYTYHKNILVHIIALYMYVYYGYINVVFKVFKYIYYMYNMNILRVYPIWSINVMYFIGFLKVYIQWIFTLAKIKLGKNKSFIEYNFNIMVEKGEILPKSNQHKSIQLLKPYLYLLFVFHEIIWGWLLQYDVGLWPN